MTRTFTVNAVTVGTFNLGEADKILTFFTEERGLTKAVAKGARKPKSKMAGRSELLNVNRFLIHKGRSLDIITQAETLETFLKLRSDLNRLSYGLYFAELTRSFGQGLEDDPAGYFYYLRNSLNALCGAEADLSRICLNFEFGLLQRLGLKPELTFCVACRKVLTEKNLAVFHKELGGVICSGCYSSQHSVVKGELSVAEDPFSGYGMQEDRSGTDRLETHITPLVWKQLVLSAGGETLAGRPQGQAGQQSLFAAGRIIKSYLEHRAGRRMKALDLVLEPGVSG